MILLKKLSWSNCFSYGPDNVLLLDENVVTQIIGVNGMGKSSIPLIVEEALFNKNSKGIKKADIPNRYINDGYSISLEFSKDQNEYVVTVIRKSSIKVKLEMNGDDISSHTATNTYKTIQDIMGVDFKTFSQLVYQNTNASLQFLTATDTNRKKFLIDLLHLEDYVKLFEIFKEASRQSGIRIAEVGGVVSTVETWLKDNILSDTNIQPMLDIDIQTDETQKHIGRVTSEIENISERNKKISRNNQHYSMLNKINLEENNSIKATKFESYDSLQERGGQLRQIAAGSTQALSKLEKLGLTCPTCEQQVDQEWKNDYISEEQNKLRKAQEELNKTILVEIERIKKNNAQIEQKNRVQEDWENLYRSIDRSLPKVLSDRNELDKRLQELQKELTDKKTSLQKLTAENQKRTRQNTRIQVIQEQSDSFQIRLNSARKQLAVEEKQASSLEILKKAFSTNGLIAYKIENLVKELEELTNTYLAELSDGRFTLEFVVSNDKLNVQITDNGNIVDISALSSGELARVNTATLIAIRKLMSSISKSRINVLFLDEVISVLDDVGREKLVEVLLGEEQLNTYVVSHGWQHPLLDKIEIVKVGNVSCIEG